MGEIQTNIDLKRDQTKSLVVSKIFDNQNFGYLKITVERPLRLNFAVTDERIAQFRRTSAFVELALSRKRKDKKKIVEEELEGQEAQAAILEVLEGMKGPFAAGEVIKDRGVFAGQLTVAFEASGLTVDSKLSSALLGPGSLGERDPSAEICLDKKGNAEPDPELRDT